MNRSVAEGILRRTAQLSQPAVTLEGTVDAVRGGMVYARLPSASIGDVLRIQGSRRPVVAEVVGFEDGLTILLPYDRPEGIGLRDSVQVNEELRNIVVSDAWLGRVVDAFGAPLDGGPVIPRIGEPEPIMREPLPPLARDHSAQPLGLGIRVLDAFTPCARGQRMGIFAGPGVGKSVLLGEIAKGTEADVIVLCLVGERGREVGHFVSNVLGEAIDRSVVVVATSDRPPNERLRAAWVATAVAEYHRDHGRSVLLFVDSLTRFAMAQREVGLAIGEPPTQRGYPPSTFAILPRLIERAGALRGSGAITALYTILVEGDEVADPIADAARGLLDGHILLSRTLADRGLFPAVDVLRSLSRLAPELWSVREMEAARTVRSWLSRLEDSRDLVAIGAYQRGQDPELDRALAKQADIERFISQAIDVHVAQGAARAALVELAGVGR